MPIHFRSLTREYNVVEMDRLQRNVRDAEFMLRAFRRGDISAKLFSDFRFGYTKHSLLGGWSDVIVKEVYSEDENLKQEAEELVNRNERILEQLRAASKVAGKLLFEDDSSADLVESMLQARVEELEEDPDKEVYFPLPSLD